MNTSEQINEIATALSKAQGQIHGAIKDSTNPHFKSQYADLASIWDACRGALSGNGLSVVQMTAPSEKDEVVVTTRVLHSSGQWIEGVLALPQGQSFSAETWHTYLKGRFLGAIDVPMPNGKTITIPNSTANLDVGEFNIYQTQVEAFANENGAFLEDEAFAA